MYVTTSGLHSNNSSGYTQKSTIKGAPWIRFSGCGGENPPQRRSPSPMIRLYRSIAFSARACW